ncbi:MAG: DUF72 domain-containing protein [Rhodothermales bacterium]|nr:DUF72 domain-containing protein [Rhodothermales bacterium]
MSVSNAWQRERIEVYDFRALYPNLRFGTASDRYAGWIGQIYPDTYTSRLSSRTKKLDGRSFAERTLPVESVVDYFDHFEVLELDFTFYRPLREADGGPSNNYFVLQQYADHAPEGARFFLKAPQLYTARTLRGQSGGAVSYSANTQFLHAGEFQTRFLEPATEILGNRLLGILFEQEYQRVSESPDPEQNIADLDGFFSQLPPGIQLHLELRSPHFLSASYFAWLESRGLGFVFSHWTWLPSLRDQWRLCGERFTARDGQVVARLLTPLGMPYATAYAQAHPFDQPLPAIADSEAGRAMVLDTTALAYQAFGANRVLNIIVNNRAWGNAPALARAIAHRIVDEEARRSG